MNAPGIDIVVPIYNARKDVQACVASVLQHARGDWRLLLVDDASTDEALVQFLRASAKANERVIYLRNKVNGGFVVTANHGMRHAAGRDVLLLNSDTIVTAGFLEKHVACVYAEEKTGIASPFTNNGTVCSIPVFCQDNELPDHLSIDEYAVLVERISYRAYPELVTAVGFCMYIKAAVIKKIGLLDEAAFGRGFGEENDFCERAKKRGWKIRLVDDCFIAHMGKASFGAEGKALEHKNSQVLSRMHPNYFPDVHRYIADNPLQRLQTNVRFHLQREKRRANPAAMFVLHASPVAAHAGGTEFFVRKLVEGLALPRALIVWPEWKYVYALEVIDGNIDEACSFAFEVSRPPDPLMLHHDDIARIFAKLIDVFGVAFVHIHHLMRWPLQLVEVLSNRNIPCAFTVHDFLSVCPSFNMMDRRTHEACPCDDSTVAEQCIRHQCADLNLPVPKNPLAYRSDMRVAYAKFLDHCDAVLTPSDFAAQRVAEFHPTVTGKIHVIPHGYDAPDCTPNDDGTVHDGPLRVAVFGRLADPAKGAASYLTLMDKTRDCQIEWHLFGNLDAHGLRQRINALGLNDRIVDHGNYVQAEICRKLNDAKIDMALILPLCDETFCFTLSEAWLAGVPVIASRRGALVKRCEQSGAGILVDDVQQALEHLRAIADDQTRLASYRNAAASFRHSTWAENIETHRAILDDWLARLSDVSLDETIGEKAADWLLDAFQNARQPASHSLAVPYYHRYWWYQLYLYAKPFIPPGMRRAMKAAYLRIKDVARSVST